ncbi:MAG: phosphatidylserine decarboxylase family protein [Bacteroidetes bacterium]|nr:phosphatidylserine decarboxylase family protein [Bacteroidota bacterium]
MKIHKAGHIIILIIGLILVVLTSIINNQFPEIGILHFVFYFAELVFFFFVIRFFRVPKRKVVRDANSILCSADGKVVAIEEVFVDEYFNAKRLQVSVFMSPMNVHVNWYPIGGIVKFAKHHPGKHYPAFLPKSSTDNEHSTIVVQNENGHEIMIRQIAGSVARRIIFHSETDQKVDQFDEFGIIKFGSRVDLFLPLDAKVNVKLSQKVCAGIDTIAFFN